MTSIDCIRAKHGEQLSILFDYIPFYSFLFHFNYFIRAKRGQNFWAYIGLPVQELPDHELEIWILTIWISKLLPKCCLYVAVCAFPLCCPNVVEMLSFCCPGVEMLSKCWQNVAFLLTPGRTHPRPPSVNAARGRRAALLHLRLLWGLWGLFLLRRVAVLLILPVLFHLRSWGRLRKTWWTHWPRLGVRGRGAPGRAHLGRCCGFLLDSVVQRFS